MHIFPCAPELAKVPLRYSRKVELCRQREQEPSSAEIVVRSFPVPFHSSLTSFKKTNFMRRHGYDASYGCYDHL